MNTPGASRSKTRSKQNFFKKHNSNKFATLNTSSGMVSTSMNMGHIKSTINPGAGKSHKTRHSIDLEKQHKLQKKYQDSLKAYPQRYTPTGYDSSNRPSSVIDTIM